MPAASPIAINSKLNATCCSFLSECVFASLNLDLFYLCISDITITLHVSGKAAKTVLMLQCHLRNENGI